MVKISIIGAGSGCFSMGIIRDLSACKGLAGSTVSLMDIDKERLDAVYELCLRYMKELGGNLKFEKTMDRRESLTGADFVINVALAAPHQRLIDGWKIADKYGFGFGGSYHIKYDEAFWVNFYQFRLFEELTQDILEICPKAWHLMVANPVLAGVTYIQRKYPEAKLVGLCHAFQIAKVVAGYFGVDQDFSYQMSGSNHFVWMNKANVKDQDFFDIVDKRLAKQDADDKLYMYFGKIHADFYRRHGVIGVVDTLGWTGASWPWFYHSDDETKKEYDDYDPAQCWDWYFKHVDKAVADFKAVAKNPEQSVTEFMKEIPPDDFIISLVESLACDVPRIMYINTLNTGGAVPGIPEDFGIEVEALCQKDEVRLIQAEALPRAIQAYVLRDRVAPVEMELEAYRTGKMSYLEELVLMDKWATSIKQVRNFVNEIMDLPYHKEMKAHFDK